MMNYILPVAVILSFISAIFTGKTAELSSAVISSGTDAVKLLINLSGVICLWCGITRIGEKSGLTELFCKLLSPVLKLIFPKLRDKEASEAISMNITANFLGLGNAATPLGLKAMEKLQKLNPSPLCASDDMVRFVVINSAAVHLIPTTVSLLRTQHGSTEPTAILVPALFTSVCAVSVGLLMTHFLRRFFK